MACEAVEMELGSVLIICIHTILKSVLNLLLPSCGPRIVLRTGGSVLNEEDKCVLCPQCSRARAVGEDGAQEKEGPRQQAGRQENSARHRKEDKWARCGSADWGDGTYKPGGSTLERKEPGLSYIGNWKISTGVSKGRTA